MLDIIIILFLIGLGSGVLGALTGGGGGIIIAPALAFMGFPPSVIASSSILAVAVANLSANITYIKKNLSIIR